MILRFMESTGDDERISIDQIYSAPESIGRVLSLSYGDVIGLLERLQNEGKVRLTRTAGLNQVVVNAALTSAELLRAFYESQSKGDLLHG
jgi:hypothetical protein